MARGKSLGEPPQGYPAGAERETDEAGRQSAPPPGQAAREGRKERARVKTDNGGVLRKAGGGVIYVI